MPGERAGLPKPTGMKNPGGAQQAVQRKTHGEHSGGGAQPCPREGLSRPACWGHCGQVSGLLGHSAGRLSRKAPTQAGFQALLKDFFISPFPCLTCVLTGLFLLEKELKAN